MSESGESKGFLGELWSFARHYWMWWALPIALLALAVVVLAVLGSGGEGGFDYDLF